MKQAKQIKSQPKSQASPKNGQDALELLKEDHQKVRKLFKDYEKIKHDENSSDEKYEIVNKICVELTVHTQIEEEIFYPAVRDAIDDDDLMDEAEVEHAAAKELIAQLEAMDPEDDHYDAKVLVLSEQIEHHIIEEQEEMFRKVKRSELQTLTLGKEMIERKKELLSEYGMVDEPMNKGTGKRTPIRKREPSTIHR